MTEFDAGNSDTWPALLTAEQVAAIFQIKPATLRKRVELARCHPAPLMRATEPGRPEKPYRWRKADILRRVGKVAA